MQLLGHPKVDSEGGRKSRERIDSGAEKKGCSDKRHAPSYRLSAVLTTVMAILTVESEPTPGGSSAWVKSMGCAVHLCSPKYGHSTERLVGGLGMGICIYSSMY